MPIEVVVGLPHLREGPLIARARAMQVPVLVSANCLSRWSKRRGRREWTGWRLGGLRNTTGLKSIDLDSAGFVVASHYGGFPWTIDDYVDLCASHPWRRFASADYCTEAEIASDREEVLDRISRTIRANLDTFVRARDAGIADRLMPVIQGRRPSDYERCAEALGALLPPGTVVGVGSMCRREVGGPEGVIAVFEHLDRVLPGGVLLHGFGVKGTALPSLRGLEHRITSVDSQAYGIRARRDAQRRGISKSESFVADHMERWMGRQLDRARQRPATPPSTEPVELLDEEPTDPWEAAISQARSQIRELIESGDLNHDEITCAWVQEWAADLYRQQRAA